MRKKSSQPNFASGVEQLDKKTTAASLAEKNMKPASKESVHS